ncbi:hypothetical protein OSK55_17600, partial [Escherichia coli]|nr:hypothetical protein [Escherichia coli]
MESYSQNSNKLDFQHEARILNGIWLITALGLVATAGLAWGAKYLEITATKYDSPPMYVAIGLLLLCMYGLSGNDSNLLIVFYVQIMPDDFVMQLHR